MLWCCFFKPGNIFVNHDLSQVQVGDFGLACCLQHSSEDVTLMVQPSSKHPLKHKGEIGTKLYAAPEQLRGKCDSKVSEQFCMLENKLPYEVGFLTFRGPCNMIYSYNESQRDALFLRFI